MAEKYRSGRAGTRADGRPRALTSVCSGTYIKKVEYLKEAYNPHERRMVQARRTRAEARSFETTDGATRVFALARYWPAADAA